MKRLVVWGLALVGASAMAQPIVVMDGSAADVLYPTAAQAIQDTATGFGDSNLGRPDIANGSELDAAYAVVNNATGDPWLYLVLAGNFETNGNKVEIFFDTRSGGQQQLSANNPPVAGLPRMGPGDEGPGLKFDSGFTADFYISVSAYGLPATIYVDYAELYDPVNAPNPAGYYCGAGFTKCETSGGQLSGGDPGAPLIYCTIDNSNIAGVDGDIVNRPYQYNGGAGVRTGLELAIPLSIIGNPTSNFRICAFINGINHDWVSNQSLAGMFGQAQNLGEPRLVDFTTIAGNQYFTVPVAPVRRGACCTGSGTCSITTPTGCAGTYLGDNTSCDGNPCDQIPAGRCCHQGNCYIRTQAECTAMGGVWYGAGTDCTGCPCPPFGACCLSDTNCVWIDQAGCAGLGGDYAGDYTRCQTNTCLPQVCCISNECFLLRQHICAAQGGTFVAGLTSCAGDPCSPAIQNPHVAGDFQGWNPTSDPMTETFPGSNIWVRSYAGLVPGSPHQFKITNGLPWSDPLHRNFPPANSWVFADAQGTITITYDANVYGDGWAPNINRLPLPASMVPTTWNAPGSYQSQIGGNNWDPNNPNTVMVETPPGSGIYKFEGSGLTPGTYYWKAVCYVSPQGDWFSCSWDSRSVNTANMEFVIGASSDVFRLWCDALTGVVRVEVISNPCANQLLADANCDGQVNAFDIDAFVLALTNPAAWESQYGANCDLMCVADCNQDGELNAFDIDPFVDILTGV